MTRRLRAVLAAAGLSLAAPPAAPQSADYLIETVVQGLEHPWSMAFLPDGGALVTERPGRLRLVDPEGRLHAEPVQGVPEVHVGGQAGLKDVALAPDFIDSRHLYLTFACGTRTANNTCLARARLVGERLSEVETLFVARPGKRGSAHYGGRILFLPDDTLLLTLGDGFAYREKAQDTADHLGTIVRLNLDGTIPRDNPFVGRPGYAPEIYTFGHRNVQGIVHDPAGGRVVIHEHGPRGGDEINVLVPGTNYGWPAVTYGIDYSGAIVSPYSTLPGFEDPLLVWTPSIAPAGMTLYDGELFPAWQGHLLVAALAGRAVHRVRLDEHGAEGVEVLFAELDERIRDVRTGPDGAVYLLTDSAEGRVLRVVPRLE